MIRKLLATFAVAGLAAAAAVAPAGAATYTLNVGTALTQDDPLFQGLLAFEEGVESRTNGEVDIVIFPSLTLCEDNECIEQARAGANTAVIIDGGRLGSYVPGLAIVSAPYLAADLAEMKKIVTSSVFGEFNGELREKAGLDILSFNWWQGVRNMYTPTPVAKPADLDGIRCRVPDARLWIETIGSMGAVATPLAWTSVYTGIQQGVIDCAGAQTPAAWGIKLFEVTKHMAKTAHINLMTGLVTSAAWTDSLPAEFQQIVREEALNGGDIGTQATADAIAELEAKMAEAGLTINADIDKTPFVEATAGVYEMMGLTDVRARVYAEVR